MNRFEEALENSNLAIEKNPEVNLYFSVKGLIIMDDILAFILLKMNRFEEALDNCDLALFRNPIDFGSCFLKGTIKIDDIFQILLQQK
ncbi:unnamed protein product (macronuclear) [Paramecium tetraurelia]|uniref:Uncharacterized protein n=1 Tax=Paramecium tetraurelia TaxID=5888 RepID=A0BDB9_PARTE|nr:uncharacterized protein GSPATT00027564001 [Paramecium tetraurelia]CAK56536.1 unnamed protein product [Paramecium tetraurelia]|eukprot:XP_001423934.1 hypothetical protein (macronuclear) [Paramecium tetraurelia strain d4-2]